MLKLYPEQLSSQLNEGIHQAYLLLGNDPLLLQESQDTIRHILSMQGFNEHHIIYIDSSTDWQTIFSLCQTMNLFISRQTLTLVLPENGPNMAISKQLATLVRLLHKDLLLIVRGNKLTKAQENTTWFTSLSMQAVLVMCQTPEQKQLPIWVATRARRYNLRLDKPTCQLLCYYYEGNLLALAQVLNQFSLLWPDGKLTLSRIKWVIYDTAHFTPSHWVDALLTAKSKRAIHILQQLRLEWCEPSIILRTLQRELLLIITLKRQLVTEPLHKLFDKHRIWQNRRVILTEAINHLSYDQLRQAVHLLAHAELILKRDYSQSVWAKLESISLLLCHKRLTSIFY